MFCVRFLNFLNLDCVSATVTLMSQSISIAYSFSFSRCELKLDNREIRNHLRSKLLHLGSFFLPVHLGCLKLSSTQISLKALGLI